MRRYVEKLIYGCLFLLPWFWWPGAYVQYEVPKTWLLWGGAFLLGVLTLIGLGKRGAFSPLSRRVVIPLVFFLGWVMITSLMGADVMRSWGGNYYRSDGLVTLFSLVGFGLIVAWWRIDSEKLLETIAWSSTLIACGMVIQWLVLHRVNLGFGNPHFAAGFLVVTLPAMILRWQSCQKKWLWGVLLLIQHGAIVATGSWLSVGMVPLVWLGWWGMKNKQRLLIAGFGWVIILGGLGWYLLRPGVNLDPESRSRLWRRSIQAVQQRPVFGWGWANVDRALEHTAWPFPVQHDVYIDKAHSEVMELLVTIGVAGFGLYGWLWWEVIRALRFKSKEWLLTGLVWLVVSQLNISSVSTELMGWLVVAMALFNDQERK